MREMSTEDAAPVSLDTYGPDTVRVLIPRTRIAARLQELASEISDVYRDRELTVLGVLTGSLVFVSDLIRLLPMPVRVELMRVGSYPGAVTKATDLTLHHGPTGDLKGRHVLIVDDILDAGKTLAFLQGYAESRVPACIRTCVLLSKRRPGLTARPAADFVGFEVDDHFVVGYGLDYDELYRNLPDICILDCLAGGPSP